MKKIMIASQVGFALLLCQVHLAQASTLEALTSPSNTAVVPNGTGDATAGYEFLVGTQPLTVSSLGVWDPTSSGFGGSGTNAGLSVSHNVGIWAISGGTPLASATVPAGISAGEINGYLYAANNLGPITLLANTDYVIGFNILGDNYHTSATPAVGVGPVFNTPDVNFVERRLVITAGSGGALTFPASPLGGGTAWDPNFQFQVVVPTPEPSSVILLGLSAAGLLVAACRQRRRDA